MEQLPVQCPSCGKRFAAPANRAGQTLKCLNCQTPIRIPAAGAKPAARPPMATPASRPPAYRPPPAAAGADNSGFVIKLAAGVGGAVVVLLLIVTVVSSLGGSGNATADPAAAATSNSASTATNPRSTPVSTPAADDPSRSYYERHGWVRVVDRNNRFAIWMPRKPTLEYEADRANGREITYATAKLSRRDACEVSYFHYLPTQTVKPPREAIASILDGMKTTRSVLSEKWGEHNGMIYLECVAHTQNDTTKSYDRVYVGDGYLAVVSWFGDKSFQFDEEAIGQLFDSFEKLP